MKSRAMLMLGLAIVLAVGAVFLAQDWLQGRTEPKTAAIVPAARIVVARNALDFGAIIREEHLRHMVWPSKSIPEGAFTSVKQVVGKGEHRVALRRIEVNEPVLKSKVSGFGGRASLSAVISQKMRAATIRVNDVRGVAGFVLPGDRVDVLVTRDPISGKRNSSNNLITDVLLQNVKVLAIDQNSNESKGKPSVAKAVTLEVTPRQVQKLVLAQRVGTLSLALRNVNNVSAAAARTVKIRDLRVGEANVASTNSAPKKAPAKNWVRATSKKPSRRPVSTIRIIRGVKSSEYEVRHERAGSTASKSPYPLYSPRRKAGSAVDRRGVSDRNTMGNKGAPRPPSGSSAAILNRRHLGRGAPAAGQEAMADGSTAPHSVPK